MAEELKKQSLVPSGATEFTVQNLRSVIYTMKNHRKRFSLMLYNIPH